MHNIPNKPRLHPTLPTPIFLLNPDPHLKHKQQKTTAVHPHNKSDPANIHSRQDKHKINLTTLITQK